MTRNKNKIKDNFVSGKNKNENMIARKRIRKIFYGIKYISPLTFNKESNFFYEITKILKIIETKESFDKFKINNEDIKLLNEKTNLIEEQIKKNQNIIILNEYMANLVENWKPIETKLTKEELIIKEILEKTEDRISLSCRKIANILKEKYNLNICKSKVNLIIKNRLKLSYRKTVIKNSKILSKNSIKMVNIFLKVIIRAIKLNYELIYLDESKIQQINSNLHCWRGKGENIFQNIKNYQKKNLLLAVSPQGFIYYNINSENTNTENFRKFFEGILKAIGEERKRNCVFIMDNLPTHVSSTMKKFYQENKINVLTNIPYLSSFNMIELSFKKIKQRLYRKAYNNIFDAVKDTKLILESDDFKNSLLSQYFDTLNEYLNFLSKYNIYK